MQVTYANYYHAWIDSKKTELQASNPSWSPKRTFGEARREVRIYIYIYIYVIWKFDVII